MIGLGKDYIWSELFQHFNAAFLKKVEEIAHAITELYYINQLLNVGKEGRGVKKSQNFEDNICTCPIGCFAEGYAHFHADYNPLLMFFIGFWWPILGTTVGHEGHHGSASPNPMINALFRWGYNVNGESTLHWIQYHLGINFTRVYWHYFLTPESSFGLNEMTLVKIDCS